MDSLPTALATYLRIILTHLNGHYSYETVHDVQLILVVTVENVVKVVPDCLEGDGAPVERPSKRLYYHQLSTHPDPLTPHAGEHKPNFSLWRRVLEIWEIKLQNVNTSSVQGVQKMSTDKLLLKNVWYIYL